MDPNVAIYAGLIGAFALGVAFLYWRERKRTKELEAAALRLGMSFKVRDEDLLQQPFAVLPLFREGRSKAARNVLRGGDIWIFGYSFTRGHGKSSSTYKQTVAAIHVPGRQIPSFRLTPEGLLDKLHATFGGQDIDFPEDPTFSKAFRLQAPEESSARALFDVGLRQHMLAMQGWSLEGKQECLIAYQRSKRIAPEALSSFAQEFRGILDRVSQRSAGRY